MQEKYKVGQMRVIETILALFIIVAALTFTSIMATSPSSQKYEPSDLEKLGYNVLHNLDEHGLLANFIYNSNFTFLMSALRVCLPSDVYFNLTIFSIDESGQLHNEHSISFGWSDYFENADFVSTVTYVLAGQNYEYDFRILRLKLVRG